MSNLYNIYRTTTEDSKTQIPGHITLQLKEYLIRGAAIITTMDNAIGSIKMNDFMFSAEGIESEDQFMEIIASLLNDNGFGSEEIRGAYIEIFAIYRGPGKTQSFIKSDFIAKRGTLSTAEKELAYNTYFQF
jgi:hypothetical protein